MITTCYYGPDVGQVMTTYDEVTKDRFDVGGPGGALCAFGRTEQHVDISGKCGLWCVGFYDGVHGRRGQSRHILHDGRQRRDRVMAMS